MASRRPRAGSPGMSAAFGASLFVIVGILAVGFWASTREDDGAETAATGEAVRAAPGSTPFDDLPPEEPPTARAARGSGVGPFEGTPGELLGSFVWQVAQDQAATAQEWLVKATEARDAEDHAEYQRCAGEAKDLLEAAFEATAGWEDDVVQQFGDRDPTVRRILRTRQDWIQKLVVLRKTTSR